MVVKEVHNGVDIDSNKVKELKYPVSDTREHSIGEHLSFAAIHMIAGGPSSQGDRPAADPYRVYGGLPEEKRERYNTFMEAY